MSPSVNEWNHSFWIMYEKYVSLWNYLIRIVSVFQLKEDLVQFSDPKKTNISNRKVNWIELYYISFLIQGPRLFRWVLQKRDSFKNGLSPSLTCGSKWIPRLATPNYRRSGVNLTFLPSIRRLWQAHIFNIT